MSVIASNEPKFTVQLSASQLTVIERGLLKLPGEMCIPVLNSVGAQIEAQKAASVPSMHLVDKPEAEAKSAA